ncbi:chaperone NapD [Ideonella sp.]|uniref:chaperone NapD n=1 Tax=Ideonella sp. TaxID=1929293 RepID=UPI0035AEA10C
MSAEPELHIAGVLVHARPEGLAATCDAIGALPRTDVAQSSAEGRVVVVVEADSGHGVMRVIDALRALPGVVDVALVYQHAEPAAAMNETMPQETP